MRRKLDSIRVSFTVSRTGSTTAALTVNYTLGGTATNGVDYQTLTGSVMIAAGQSSAAITVTPINDNVVEPTETVIVTLSQSAGYTVGSPASATVYIADNDDSTPPNTTITSPELGTITGQVVTFTWTGSDNVSPTLLYAHRLDPIEPNFGFGYGDSLSYSDLPNGNYTFYVKAIDQAGNEDPSPATQSFTVSRGPALTVNPSAAMPGQIVTTTWSGIPSPSATDWIALYANGQPNSNYLDWIYVSCTKSAGSAKASGSCPFTLPISLPFGIYQLRLLANDGYTSLVTSNSLTVGDVTVNVTATTPTALEGGSNPGVFTVSRTGSTASSLTVNYTVSGTATNGVDYQALPGTVVIPSGQVAVAIIVMPIDDSAAEGNEYVSLTLSSNAAYIVGSPSSAAVTILDNEETSADTSAPETYITRGPAGTITTGSATFTWTGLDGFVATGLTYAYRLDPLESNFSSYGALTTKSYTNLTDGTYTFYVKAKDAAGNEDFTPAFGSFIVNTNPEIGFTDTTVADFAQGSPADDFFNPLPVYISETENGEVILSPYFGDEFYGTQLSPNWFAMPWAVGGGVSVNDGKATLDGVLIGSSWLYTMTMDDEDVADVALEFVATFSAAPDQEIGFASDLMNGDYAVFATGAGGALYARSSLGGDILIPGNWLGAPHRFRIIWSFRGSISFSIDGKAGASGSVRSVFSMPLSMRLLASDQSLGGGGLSIDWMRLTRPPITRDLSGAYLSRVFDAGSSVYWRTLGVDRENFTSVPLTFAVGVTVRQGNTPTPDSSWTAFSPTLGQSRYLQYKAVLSLWDESDPTPALQSVTLTAGINATPDTTITSNPATLTNSTSAAFTFISSLPNSTFSCSLDNAPFTACASPKNYSNLTAGSHIFQVRAIDAGGNTDPTPASYSWSIDELPPETSILAGPTGMIGVRNATFSWSGSDDATPTASLTYAYRLDPLDPSFSSFGAATSKAYSNLADGGYTFYVKAQDQVGNQDTSPASRSFTVTTGPNLSVTPSTALPGATVTVTWSGILSPSATDWIALYFVGQPNSNYLAWLYVNCAKQPGSPQASGSCPFALPPSLTPGIYELRLLANDGFVSLATTSLTVSGPAVVTIVASDPNAAEAGLDPGVYTVSRTGTTTSSLTVNYAVSGTATNGADYQALSGSLVIQSGQSTATITVTPIDDTTVEGNETVIVTLSANAAYSVGTPSSATVTIVDDEPPLPAVTIVATDPNAAEAGLDPGVFTVSRTGSTTASLTVNYIVSGTATNGTDYQTLAGSVMIGSGQSAATITVTPIDDTSGRR